MGNAEFEQGKEMDSLKFYRRAVELDPNFAWVHARMGVIYSNVGENDKAIEATRKAYELRDRVSEREKLYITEHYYQTVTGEQDKEMETLELYSRTYPNDETPPNNLAVGYEMSGEFTKAMEKARDCGSHRSEFNRRVGESGLCIFGIESAGRGPADDTASAGAIPGGRGAALVRLFDCAHFGKARRCGPGIGVVER